MVPVAFDSDAITTLLDARMTSGASATTSTAVFFRERWINADPAVVDRNAVALRPTQCSKGLLECRAARDRFDVTRGKLAHYDDAPLRAGSLRPRRDRPSRHATNQSDELATLHSTNLVGSHESRQGLLSRAPDRKDSIPRQGRETAALRDFKPAYVADESIASL